MTDFEFVPHDIVNCILPKFAPDFAGIGEADVHCPAGLSMVGGGGETGEPPHPLCASSQFGLQGAVGLLVFRISPIFARGGIGGDDGEVAGPIIPTARLAKVGFKVGLVHAR